MSASLTITVAADTPDTIPTDIVIPYSDIFTTYGDALISYPIWTESTDIRHKYFVYYISILRDGKAVPGIQIDYGTGRVDVAAHATTAASGTYTITVRVVDEINDKELQSIHLLILP